MPLIVVWTGDVVADDTTQATSANERTRCAVHTDHIAYATEKSLTSGEVYVEASVALPGAGYVLNIFEQTLDSLRLADRDGNIPKT
jgi:hypothetical protein